MLNKIVSFYDVNLTPLKSIAKQAHAIHLYISSHGMSLLNNIFPD